MSAASAMPRAAWVFPVLAALFFVVASALGIGFTAHAHAASCLRSCCW